MTTDRNPLAASLAAIRRPLVFVGLLSLFANLLMLTLPLYTLQLFDRVISSRSEATLAWLSLLALAALAVWTVLESLRSQILIRIGTWLEGMLGRETLARTLTMAAGEPKAVADLAQLRLFTSGKALPALFDLPWVPVYVLVMALIHPILGALAAVAVAVFLAMAWLNDLAVRAPQARANAAGMDAGRLAQALSRNRTIVTALGLTTPLTGRWADRRVAAMGAAQQGAMRTRLIAALVKGWRFAVQVAVMGLGAWLVLRQEIGAGAMVAGSILLGRGQAPIEGAIDTWR